MSLAKMEIMMEVMQERMREMQREMKMMEERTETMRIQHAEENDEIYISGSKQNIDNYIRKNEYRKAFGLLILVLERLDDNQKNEFIDYYSKKMANMGIFNNIFPSR